LPTQATHFGLSRITARVPLHRVPVRPFLQRPFRVAEEIGADEIIMAAHRPSLKDYLIGPNTDRVVRHARCSVQVVRRD